MSSRRLLLRKIRHHFRLWSHKALLARGLEEVACLLSSFNPSCVVVRRPSVKAVECGGMCEVGQSIQGSSKDGEGRGTAGTSNYMQYLMNCDMLTHAYMNSVPSLVGDPSLLGPEWNYLLSLANPSDNATKKGSEEEPPKKPNGALIDLSRKTGLATVDMEGKTGRTAPKQKSKAKQQIADDSSGVAEEKTAVVKRNYSQADLDKAVNDIRCGRLGTRRASVVYGIPRSTLRNKIYKLEAADEQAGVAPMYKRRKAGGQRSADKLLAEAVETTTKLAKSTDKKSTSPTPVEETPSPVLEIPTTEVVEVKDDFVVGKTVANGIMNELPTATAITTPTVDFTAPLSSIPPVDPLWATHSLASGADLITQAWQTYFGRALTAELLAAGFFMPQTPMVEEKPSESMDEASNGNPFCVSVDWKKQRPKRGQYRKYDKEALDEAVQSVRRGEMSVHRAGSFYGVPHSTLEYKVKERNLMRQKRKEGGGTEDDSMTPSPTGQDDRESSSELYSPQPTPVM